MSICGDEVVDECGLWVNLGIDQTGNEATICVDDSCPCVSRFSLNQSDQSSTKRRVRDKGGKPSLWPFLLLGMVSQFQRQHW